MAQLAFINLGEDRKAEVSQFTRDTIINAADKAGLERVFITSARRLPIEQAAAMYDNIILRKRIVRYREPGRKVTELCKTLHWLGKPKSEVIEKMSALIIDLAEQGQRVSLHCVGKESYATTNVVDISDSMPAKMAESFIKSLAAEEATARVIQSVSSSIRANKVSFDPNEPAIHFEIRQQ